jgi:hypothetical protein
MHRKRQERQGDAKYRPHTISLLDEDWDFVDRTARKQGLSNSRFIGELIRLYQDRSSSANLTPSNPTADYREEDITQLLDKLREGTGADSIADLSYLFTEGRDEYASSHKLETQVLHGPQPILRRAISMLANATDDQPQGDILITYQSHDDITKVSPELFEQWRNALRRVLSLGWNVKHLWRLETGEAEKSIPLIRDMLSILGLKGRYSPNCFPPGAVKLAAAHDVFVVPGQGALLFLSTGHPQYVDAAIFSSHTEFIEILSGYFSALSAVSRPLLQVFPTHPFDLEFAEAIVHAEQQPGDRFLLRAELSSTLIPQTVYENRINGILAELPEDKSSDIRRRLERLMERHKHRLQIFHAKSEKNSAIRHISSKKDIEYFVETGWRSDHVMRLDQYFVSRGEPLDQSFNQKIKQREVVPRRDRICCINYVIEQLKTYPRYELALVDQSMETDIFRVDWEVIGTQIALLYYPLKIRKNEERSLAVYEPSVASAFHGYFTDLWDSLPSESKDKEQVILWLENQIAQLKNQSD